MTDIKTILSLPIQRAPVSAQFLNTVKPEYRKSDYSNHHNQITAAPKLLPENIIANYHYITLLGREISDNLALFSEKGLIPSWNIRHIDRGMSDDMDATWKIAEVAGETKQYTEDFTLITDYFGQLAGKYLSQHQKENGDYLQEVLKTILIIEYSLFTAEYITVANKQHTNVKTMRILSRKRNELLKYFKAEFSKYSNLEFDFSKFREIWQRINRMGYNESQTYFQERVKN